MKTVIEPFIDQNIKNYILVLNDTIKWYEKASFFRSLC